MVAAGRTNKQIALALKKSEQTVKNWLASIMTKLNVQNRAEAAVFLANQKQGQSTPAP